MSKTTVVMVPRESYSAMLLSVRSIMDSLPAKTPFIVFAGKLPNVVREPIRELQRQSGFQLIETEEALLAPRARNMASGMVQTEYTCFVDNDLTVQPGWLEALEANAERNSAGAVAPLTLIGPKRDIAIHHAGSDISVIEDEKGRLRLKSVHRLDNVPLKVAEEEGLCGISAECDEFEYHCALIRTSVIREMGGHDERQTKHDHLNDSLRIKMLGHKIMFERDARVIYHAFRRFESYDWPYFFERWSYENSVLSDRTIGECWGIRKNYEDTELNFVKMHHRRAASTQIPNWTRKIRPRRIRGRIERTYTDYLVRRHMKLSGGENPHIPPPPPPNALELAGIPGGDLVTKSLNGGDRPTA